MGISWYPRPGHRIAPLALREILDAPLPDHLLGRSCPTHMRRLSDLDETAWSHFGPEVCRRLGEVVVREVQRQLNSAPRSLKTRMLPRWLDGVVLEELELEPGTYEALKREQGWLAFAKRIGQVAALRWIGARALVDFLTSLEATVGPTLDEQPQPVQTASPALDDRSQPAQAARVAKGAADHYFSHHYKQSQRRWPATETGSLSEHRPCQSCLLRCARHHCCYRGWPGVSGQAQWQLGPSWFTNSQELA